MTENLTSAIIDSANYSIPQSKPRSGKKRQKPLPYWNEYCRKAITDKNRASNEMNKNKTLDNCINYRRLKAKAQYIIKTSAREHRPKYCETLNGSTKLATVWLMAKKMNGVCNDHKINKSSAIAEMGDRGHSRHGPKRGGRCCAPFAECWEPV